MMINGIDVSTWQEEIDWEKVAQSGISFAMIRAAYGYTGVDDQFARNVDNASAAGIECGAYLYSYASSIEEAKLEAQHFLQVIAPYSLSYPVAFDIEDSSLIPLGKQLITDIVFTFCQTVEDAGYYVSIYSNLNWLHNYLDMERLSRFDVWLAQWSEIPTYTGDFGIWQYTSKGRINGIYSAVDLNISYLDYAKIISERGLNQKKTDTPPSDQDSDPSQTPDSPKVYVIESGDTMSAIADKFGISLLSLISANPQISDPNIIYPGQELTIPQANPTAREPVHYTVVRGDTMSGIAEKNNITLSALIDANPHVKNPNLITPGQILNIPQTSVAFPSNTSQYTVESGDTMSSIAQRYGIGLSELISANPQIKDPSLIYPEQIINIP